MKTTKTTQHHLSVNDLENAVLAYLRTKDAEMGSDPLIRFIVGPKPLNTDPHSKVAHVPTLIHATVTIEVEHECE